MIEGEWSARFPEGSAGFGLYIDAGLEISPVTGEAIVSLHGAYNVAWVPSVAPGGRVALRYHGRPHCGAAGPIANCHFGRSALHFSLEGGVLPSFYTERGVFRVAQTAIVDTPGALEHLVSGTRIEDRVVEGRHTTTWQLSGEWSSAPISLVLGQFDAHRGNAAELSVWTYGVRGAQHSLTKFSEWMPRIVNFLDGQVNRILPYQALQVVEIPLGVPFPGTVGFAITYLNESYGRDGDDVFEETLAHENAHQWWGALTAEKDGYNARMVTEGMATLSQIDYTQSTYHPDDKISYRARRFREHRLVLAYFARSPIPPVYVSDSAGVEDYTIWAYVLTSAFLQHVRGMVGDDAFSIGVQNYAADCLFRECSGEDLLRGIEQASGAGLEPAIQAWYFDRAQPVARFAFSQSDSGDGQKVLLFVSGYSLSALPMEFWLTAEDGEVFRRRARLENGTIEFAVPRAVRAVDLAPWHRTFVRTVRDDPLDLDLDGRVDGRDLIRCALQEGQSVHVPRNRQDTTIFPVNLDFLPECDLDGDGRIADREVARWSERFEAAYGPSILEVGHD